MKKVTQIKSLDFGEAVDKLTEKTNQHKFNMELIRIISALSINTVVGSEYFLENRKSADALVGGLLKIQELTQEEVK